MLKGIDPLLHADLLHILAAMGHGDELVVVDSNFPAVTVGRRVARLDGVGLPRAAEAILSVFPLDQAVEFPILRMEVAGEPETVTKVQQEFHSVAEAAEGRAVPLGSIERFAFYERAKRAFAVVATSEARTYGCFILSKGVIA